MESSLNKLIEQHRDRWSAFGAGTGIVSLSERLSPDQLRQYEIFRDFPDNFLERISPDVSVASWKEGALLFEQGSYIDLAFWVIDGEVAVHFAQAPGDPSSSERRRPSGGEAVGADQATTLLEVAGELEGTVRVSETKVNDQRQPAFLATLDADLPPGDVLKLGPGEIFGEIGALNGWPQSVTAQASSACTLLQIRVPALRRMKEKSESFKKRIDAIYRKRALFGHLKASPLFRTCSEEFLHSLEGSVDLVSCGPGDSVVEEDAPAQDLYVVRSGYMKLSQRVEDTRRVLSYVAKGMVFGAASMLMPGEAKWPFTVTSVGYSELIRIGSADFGRLLESYPEVEAQLWEQAAQRVKETGIGKSDPRHSEFIEFALEKGLVEGNSILVIDLDLCTRCDDCVRACAETHDGLPRFIREGDRYANLLIAKACYHCEDPVCLIGCPTGAIRRANVGDVVEISDDLCIGCNHCAENCPYDAIVMQDTGTRWPGDALPKLLRGEERFLASKCDLCHTSAKGPACVRNCPQGCAFRVGSLEEFQQLLDTNS